VKYGADLAWIHHAGFSDFAESAAPGLLELLWKHGVHAGRVVEIGCGTGILARELTRAGFDVMGFDVSPEMIAIARRTAPSAHFAVASFDAVAIPDCEAVVSMGEVLNHGTLAGVRALIAEAAQARMVVFDIAERDAYPPYDERRIEGDDWSVIVVKESDGATLTRRVLTFRAAGDSMRRSEEVHRLELYDRAEITALLREHGFRVARRRSYGAYRLPKGHAVYVGVR
jgi:SAM-dependent methyltransferase